jgi:hypothetical protein
MGLYPGLDTPQRVAFQLGPQLKQSSMPIKLAVDYPISTGTFVLLLPSFSVCAGPDIIRSLPCAAAGVRPPAKRKADSQEA